MVTHTTCPTVSAWWVWWHCSQTAQRRVLLGRLPALLHHHGQLVAAAHCTAASSSCSLSPAAKRQGAACLCRAHCALPYAAHTAVLASCVTCLSCHQGLEALPSVRRLMSAVYSRAEAAPPAHAAICRRPRPSDGAGQTLGVCHAVGLPALAPLTWRSMTAGGGVILEAPPCEDSGPDEPQAAGQACSQGVEPPLQGGQLSWERGGLACPASCANKTGLAHHMLAGFWPQPGLLCHESAALVLALTIMCYTDQA